jgi:hypothetical protein
MDGLDRECSAARGDSGDFMFAGNADCTRMVRRSPGSRDGRSNSDTGLEYRVGMRAVRVFVFKDRVKACNESTTDG